MASTKDIKLDEGFDDVTDVTLDDGFTEVSETPVKKKDNIGQNLNNGTSNTSQSKSASASTSQSKSVTDILNFQVPGTQQQNQSGVFSLQRNQSAKKTAKGVLGKGSIVTPTQETKQIDNPYQVDITDKSKENTNTQIGKQAEIQGKIDTGELHPQNYTSTYQGASDEYGKKAKEIVGNNDTQSLLDYGKVIGTDDDLLTRLGGDDKNIYQNNQQLADLYKQRDILSKSDEQTQQQHLKDVNKSIAEIEKSNASLYTQRNSQIDADILYMQKQLNSGVKTIQASTGSGSTYGAEKMDMAPTVTQTVPLTDEDKTQLKSQISSLQKKKGDFLDGASTAQSTAQSTITELQPQIKMYQDKNLIPKDASDLDKLKIFYGIKLKQLQNLKQQKEKEDNEITPGNLLVHGLEGVAGSIIGNDAANELGNSLKQRLPFSDNKTQKAITDIESQLDAIAPVIAINKSPNAQVKGFFTSAKNKFVDEATQTTKHNTSQDNAVQLQSALKDTGIQLSPERTAELEKQIAGKDKGQFKENVGSELGGMAEFMAELTATSVLPIGELGELASKITPKGRALLGVVNTAMRETTLGKVVSNAIEEGVKLQALGTVNKRLEEGANFGQGVAFSLGGELGGVLNKAVTGIFGKETPKAIELLTNITGKTITESTKMSIAELQGMYEHSKNGQDFIDNVKARYGDMDKNLSFAIQMVALATAFSGSEISDTFKHYIKKVKEELPETDKEKFDTIQHNLEDELNQAGKTAIDKVNKTEDAGDINIEQASPFEDAKADVPVEQNKIEQKNAETTITPTESVDAGKTKDNSIGLSETSTDNKNIQSADGEDASKKEIQQTEQKEVKPISRPQQNGTDYDAKESEANALERLSQGISELPADEQKAEIEKRAKEHADSYKEYLQDNPVDEKTAKLPRVADFEQQTTDALTKYVVNNKDWKGKEENKFENGGRIDENGNKLSEQAYIDLKEHIIDLRKKGETKAIEEVNSEPAKYYEGNFDNLSSEDSQQSKTESEETGLNQDADGDKKKRLLNRAYEGTEDAELKSAIEKHGLTYTTEHWDQPRNEAKAFVKEVGTDKALEALKSRQIAGAKSSYVWAELIDKVGNQIAVETNPEKLSELKKQKADLISAFDVEKRENGRAIAALLDIYKNSDTKYSLESQKLLFETVNGGKISSKSLKAIEELSSKFEEAKKQITILENEKAEREALEAQERIDLESTIKQKKPRTKKGKDLIAEGVDELATLLGAKLSAEGTERPTLVKALAKIGRGLLDEGIATAQNVSEKIREYLEDNFKGKINYDDYEKEVADEISAGNSIKFQYGKYKIPKRLIRDLTESGIHDINDLTDKVHEIAVKEYPKVTKRQIRDAITEYGKTLKLSDDEIDTAIREMKRTGKLISALEDVNNKLRPLKSGLQRDKLTQQQRELTRKIKEATKDLPVDEAENEKAWKTALDGVKSRLRNQIDDLNKQIETGEKSAAKKGIEYDDEATGLKEQRDALKKIIEDKEGKPKMSFEQRVRGALSAVQKSIENYERKIANKEFDAQEKNIVSTPELNDLRSKRDALKKVFNDLYKKSEQAEEKRLVNTKIATNKAIAEYKRRINEKEFVKAPKKPPVTADAELKEKRSELERIKEDFDELQERNRLENRTTWEKYRDGFIDALGLPKALISTIDLSAPLRQGAGLLANNPKEFGDAFAKMFSFLKTKNFDKYMSELKGSDEYKLMVDSGLSLTNPSGKDKAREDTFANTLATKIPIYKHLYGASERAYSGFLNKLRADVFMKGVRELELAGITPENSPEDFKGLARIVNNATGRGEIPNSIGPGGIKALNTIFFSPRMITSRIGMVTDLARGSRENKIMALKNLTGFSVYILTIHALGAIAIAATKNKDDKDILQKAWDDANLDPRKTDFLKNVKNDTRYEFSSGFVPIIRLIARALITGEKIDSKGRLYDLDKKGYKTDTRGTEIEQFAINKLSPVAKIIVSRLANEDVYDYHEDFNWKNAGKSLVVPLNIQDAIDNRKEIVSNPGKYAIDRVLATFGAGVQTYGGSDESSKSSDNKDKNSRATTRP